MRFIQDATPSDLEAIIVAAQDELKRRKEEVENLHTLQVDVRNQRIKIIQLLQNQLSVDTFEAVAILLDEYTVLVRRLALKEKS
jgi:hypothetical protein